jgi:hypothetical protein
MTVWVRSGHIPLPDGSDTKPMPSSFVQADLGNSAVVSE